jgi:ABC-type dipeptide/oligopeptide/nickel transport system permease component
VTSVLSRFRAAAWLLLLAVVLALWILALTLGYALAVLRGRPLDG